MNEFTEHRVEPEEGTFEFFTLISLNHAAKVINMPRHVNGNGRKSLA